VEVDWEREMCEETCEGLVECGLGGRLRLQEHHVVDEFGVHLALGFGGVVAFVQLQQKGHNLVPQALLPLVLNISQVPFCRCIIALVLTFAHHQRRQAQPQKHFVVVHFHLRCVEQRLEQLDQLVDDDAQALARLLVLVVVL
jgi:hypothetical protein